MNSTSKRRLFAGAVAISLVLAACGDDDDTTNTTGGGDATTAAPTTGGDDTTAPTTGGTGTTATPGSTAGTTGGSSAPLELAAGDVFVTGSSTVEPISARVGELALDQSGGGLKVTVEGPGTGDGFDKFCAGDADVTDASRPIDEEEVALCEENGIEYTELEIGIDGLSVITNPANEAVTCLDVPALYALIGPESEGFTNWSDANELATTVGSAYTELPDAPLDIYGPGTESGTYDTFVEFAIADLAEQQGVAEDAIGARADYTSSSRDAEIVAGIEGSDSSLGWVGYAFFVGEQDALKAIEVDGGDGCVAPTVETIGDGTYPFSRSLYIYVNNAKATENPAVASFVDLYLSDDGLSQVSDAGYVDLPADRIQATQGRLGRALRREPRRGPVPNRGRTMSSLEREGHLIVRQA